MLDIKIKLLDKELTIAEAKELYYALKGIFDGYQQITYQPFTITTPNIPFNPYTITCTSLDCSNDKSVLRVI